jgi:hypothetical protein
LTPSNNAFINVTKYIIGQLHNNVFANICGNTQTFNLGAIPRQPTLNELHNKIEIPLSTL